MMWHCNRCGQASLFPVTTCDACLIDDFCRELRPVQILVVVVLAGVVVWASYAR